MGGWVTQTPSALQRTPESFHEVLVTSCSVEGMVKYSWSDDWPKSTCPLVRPWKFWKEANALKHALGPCLFLLRAEELSTFPEATMKKVYRFLQLPMTGYLENIVYFNEAYYTGANNGIGETSRLENALGGSYAPMGKPSWLLLRKILRYDMQFPRFLGKTGLRATQKDIEFT